MFSMMRKTLLSSLAVLAVGCSMPEQVATSEGPAFTLTADEPVAAFEVTLCLSGPNPKQLFVSGHVDATARTEAGGVDVLLESLDRPESDDAFDPHARTFELAADEDTSAVLRMVADGDFRGSGERCAEPEVIQFSVDDLPPGASVEVEPWDVTMVVRWNDGSFGSGPKDDDLRIEIVRL